MKIVTHSGMFHADETMATAIVKMALGINTPVERTRAITSEMINDPDIIVIDVGLRYNPELNNFDHHQWTKDVRVPGHESCRESGVPYAAAGLLWKHFGPKIDSCEKVQGYVDHLLLQHIDAQDTGHTRYDGFTISQMIWNMNPTSTANSEQRDGAFCNASTITMRALEDTIKNGRELHHNSKDVVMEAGTREDGKVLLLDRWVQWNTHIFLREDIDDLLYVVYPSLGDGCFNIQQIPVERGSFEGKKPLPKAWAGLNGEELKAVTGMIGEVHENHTFCHGGCFIAGTTSFDQIMQLAKLACAN